MLTNGYCQMVKPVDKTRKKNTDAQTLIDL